MTREQFLAIISATIAAPFVWMSPIVDDCGDHKRVWHCNPPKWGDYYSWIDGDWEWVKESQELHIYKWNKP